MTRFTPLLIILICAIFGACSKDAKLNKQLDGKWETRSLKIITSNGLSYFVEASGTVLFEEDKGSNTGNYTMSVTYQFDDTTLQLNEVGTYTLSGDQLLRTYDNQENESRVVYINKKDLELEIPNIQNQGYFFVLKRIE